MASGAADDDSGKEGENWHGYPTGRGFRYSTLRADVLEILLIATGNLRQDMVRTVLVCCGRRKGGKDGMAGNG